jgi:drug/metabolite transporter (DMT)-like permease
MSAHPSQPAPGAAHTPERPPGGSFTFLSVLVVGVALILGLNFVMLRVALRSAGPLTVQAMVAVAAGVPMLLVSMAASPRRPYRLREAALVGVLFTGVASLATVAGVGRVGAAVGALIAASTPLMTVLMDRVIFRQAQSRTTLVGVAVGFGGVAIVVWGGTTGGDLLGALFILAASACWSMSLIALGRLQTRWSIPSLVAWQALLVVPALGLAALLVEGLAVRWGWDVVLAVAYAGVFGTGISLAIQVLVIRRGSPVHASTIAFLTPVSAALGAALILGENLALRQLIGAAVILAAVGLVLSVRPVRTEKPHTGLSAPY